MFGGVLPTDRISMRNGGSKYLRMDQWIFATLTLCSHLLNCVLRTLWLNKPFKKRVSYIYVKIPEGIVHACVTVCELEHMCVKVCVACDTRNHHHYMKYVASVCERYACACIYKCMGVAHLHICWIVRYLLLGFCVTCHWVRRSWAPQSPTKYACPASTWIQDV